MTDKDFFRMDLAETSRVSVNVLYPPEIGSVYPYNGGIQVKAGCGFPELLADVARPTGRQLVYRLPAGSYSMPFAASTAVPYDLQVSQVSLGTSTMGPDAYEPNDSYATRSNMGDGRVVSANLSSASDVDWYTFYSPGTFDTAFVTIVSRFQLLHSDMPLTLRVHDSAGKFIAEQSTGAGCTVKPSIQVGQGYYTLSVSGSAAGAYALAIGSKVTQHPVLGVDIEYATFRPGDPIEFLLDGVHGGVEAYINTDLKIRAFHLDGPAVHVTLFTEAGLKITEGVQRATDVAGEDVLLPVESSDKRFILQLDRLVQAGSTVASTVPTLVKLSVETAGP